MKNLSLAELQTFRTVSFDIDGTVYPIRKVQLRWWKKFFVSPKAALRFLQIKNTWEKRRQGDGGVPIPSEDVRFFEEFLTSMLDPTLVPDEMRRLLNSLPDVFFLSDHGAMEKLKRLGLTGKAINCLVETGELKPHPKISELLLKKGIAPETHIHIGDRWTDEEQAKMFGCSFQYHQL